MSAVNVAALFARWNGLSRSARAATVVAAAGLIVGSSLLWTLARPARVALFAAALQSEQLAEVEERLAAWNVTFTPTADNVLVAMRRRNELLLRLSLAGVPHPHIEGSNDVLKTIGALTPQSVIDAQTREGLAGDIELGLRGIEGVDDARVIVAPAKRGEFADQTSHDATASVRLRVRAGVRLSRATVDGIRAFVAAAVPGLARNRVTILDDRGLALGSGDAGDEDEVLQRSLQSALDDAFGAGSTIVRVHARGPRDGVTAAVFVDASRGVDIENVRELAAGTLGIDPRRGDTLDVAAIDFARTLVAKKDGWWLAYGAIVPLAPTVVVVIGALVALRWFSKPAAAMLRAWSERASIARVGAACAGVAPAHVRGKLANEPPHAAAAIISALPAATAAAVLDMYPPHERAAIVKRMSRANCALVPDAQTVIADA